MKTLENGHGRLFTLTAVFAAVFALSIAGPMEAWAMPGPNVNLLNNGNPRLTGTFQTLEFLPGNFPLNQAFSVWITESGSSITFNDPIQGAFTLLCSDNDGGDGNVGTSDDTVEYLGDTYIYQLADDNGAPVLVTLTAMTDIFRVTFGTDSVGGDASETVMGTGTTLTLQGGGAAVTPLKWIIVRAETNFADGNGDEKSDFSMDTLETWRFGFCGNDAVDNPLGIAEQVSKNVESWQVVLPVGGEILQLNSAALMIAGLSTGMIWIAPIALAGAGAAFGLYRLRK